MYLTHITTEGERWDLIAWRYYRDVTKIPLLVDANPHAPIRETLPRGMTLLVPVIEPDQTASQEELPPWKR
jgi:phage tail protein X